MLLWIIVSTNAGDQKIIRRVREDGGTQAGARNGLISRFRIA